MMSTSRTGREQKALKGVDLRIDDGEFVFIVGPSGSGKSTLAKLITAELRPTEGRVVVNDFNTTKMKMSRCRICGARSALCFRTSA